MAKKDLPPIEFLNQCFSYDKCRGVLVWKNRPLNHFKDQRIMQSWHSRFVGNVAGSVRHDGYVFICIGGAVIGAHRVIWAMHNGAWSNVEIDHIDGNPNNNKIENLRSVSHSENMKNLKKPKHNSSGYVGVSWSQSRKRWESYIGTGKNRKNLGRFSNLDDAIEARKSAEILYNFHLNHGRNAA